MNRAARHVQRVRQVSESDSHDRQFLTQRFAPLTEERIKTVIADLRAPQGRATRGVICGLHSCTVAPAVIAMRYPHQIEGRPGGSSISANLHGRQRLRFGKRTKPIDRAAGCACRAHQNATRFERIHAQVVHPIVQRKSPKENSGSVLNTVCKSINPRHDWLIRSDRASPGRLGRPGARPRGQRSRAPHLLLHSSISCG